MKEKEIRDDTLKKLFSDDGDEIDEGILELELEEEDLEGPNSYFFLNNNKDTSPEAWISTLSTFVSQSYAFEENVAVSSTSTLEKYESIKR